MTIQSEPLESWIATIFTAAGCLPPEGRRVAHHLVEANLVGHDSHGVIRVATYVDWLRDGKVFANKSLEVVTDTDVLAVVDGQFGLGQTIGEEAMELGIAKCARHGMAVIALRNSGHLGRIGDWALMAASAGLLSLHFVNTSGGGILVAPAGGSRRRLSANPVAAGVPVRGGMPLILDISTCTIAEGKVRVAFNRGERVPEGCLLDGSGQPTDDPRAFYADPPGAILPLGGHKGYGLSVIVEMLAGALTGGSCSNPSIRRVANNMLTIFLAPSAFGSEEEFAQEASRFIEHVKDCPTVEPGGEILMPGEPEERTKARRLHEGIELDETTLSQLRATCRRLNVSDGPAGIA
ncbi:MAG: malate/lactate/ureidoglycolate dehydrogenase [Planctomycetota bacterium]|nr:malate/lactate/ureidoglycolate dehydrogenase [Planctomycetota bacterium]